jgi:hypothetical protein
LNSIGNSRSSINQLGPFTNRKRTETQLSSAFGGSNPHKDIEDTLSSESTQLFHILTIGHTINMLEYIESSKVVCKFNIQYMSKYYHSYFVKLDVFSFLKDSGAYFSKHN